MQVKDLMSSHVDTVTPSTTVQECARKMRQVDIGVLPVWEKNKLLGMVTDRDICCRILGDGRDPATVTVREIMTGEVSSCFEDEDCAKAARVMKEKRLRRMPVINHKHKLVGFLSVDDIARFSHDLAGEVLEAAAPWPH